MMPPPTDKQAHIALEMSRKADQAEQRAGSAEAEVERLRDVLAEIRAVFDLQCPPMLPDKYVDHGAWVAHSWWNTVLGNILKREALLSELAVVSPDCPACGEKWGNLPREGCKRPWHHADQWGDIFAPTDSCGHDWLDRPESDTRECLMCGTEVAG